MRIFSFLILLVIISSCSKKLLSGKYIFSGKSIIIDKMNNYEFKSLEGTDRGPYSFSKGKVNIKNHLVYFVPDSSYYFKIRVIKYYEDALIGDSVKIIIENNDNKLSGLLFYLNEEFNGIKLDSNYTATCKSFQKSQIFFKAEREDRDFLAQPPLHKFIYSNSIQFSDVNNDDPDDKSWNVVILKASIDKSMFYFTELQPYIYKKRKLILKNWPVHKLFK